MKVYLVGGAVRDRLLGLPVKDRDYVVVGAVPDDLKRQGFRQVGADFPVFLHPETGEEYALARKERKIAPGYHGFSADFSAAVTLEEDLARRDLTINAMAEDEQGTLIDPFAGRVDLANKLLRHVSAAFVEDPVRVLRVARFSARFHHLGFVVAPETQSLMEEMVADGEVDSLVAERIWQELASALSEKNPQLFIQALRGCGALERVFPEIDRLFGVPQPALHHPEIDTGVHSLMVLHQAALLSESPMVRLAALLHDLGKGTTSAELLPSHHGHEKRSLELINNLAERIRMPAAWRQLALLVAEFHGHVHKIDELKPQTIVRWFSAMDLYRRPERLEPFLLACEADYRGRTGFENRPYPQADLVREVFAVSAMIGAAPFVERGLTGEAIQQGIREARRAAIAEWKKGQP